MLETYWNESAGTYAAEAEKISFYKVTNRELVAAGQLQPRMIIVDLSCGTGLTTRIILESLGDDCTVYAVDLSEKMLQLARGVIKSESVSFIHASADNFSRHIPEKVDRIFCNAAFWLFSDPDAVLKEIRSIMNTSGRFIFNFPDQEFDFGDGKRSEMKQVVDACLQQPTKNGVPSYSYQRIQTLANENGFRIADFKIIEVALTPEDLIMFYSIPHFGAKRLPDKSPVERREIFTKVFSALSPSQYPLYRWAQFTLEQK